MFKMISLKVFEDFRNKDENDSDKQRCNAGFCETLFEFDFTFVYNYVDQNNFTSENISDGHILRLSNDTMKLVLLPMELG